MDISHVNSQSLFRLLSLVERKEELLNLVGEIDAAIIDTLKGGTVSIEVVEAPTASMPAQRKVVVPIAAKPVVTAQGSAKPAKKPNAGRSGGLKDRILALLDASGPEGLRVKDISDKLGVKATNISVWFSTTGKKITTKIEPGRFAAKGAKPASASAAPAVAPAKSAVAAAPAKAAKKGTLSPEAKARIGAAAKARWAARRAGKAAPVAAATKLAPAKPVAAKPVAAKPVAAKKKGGISPEGRAKIAAAAKARWAKVRAGKADKKSTKA